MSSRPIAFDADQLGRRLIPEDRDLLERLVRWSEENDPDGDRFDPAPFARMLSSNRPLTPKQRSWAKGLAERLLDEPAYENLASSGKVYRGREVATPAVLQNLPKKPPGR
jgi:hypothetical protein